MKKACFAVILFCLMSAGAEGQVRLTLHADKAEKEVSPTLYGLMTEEINYSYEGGLYGQLLGNSSFREMVPKEHVRRGYPPQFKYWAASDTANVQFRVETRDRINRNSVSVRVHTNKADVGIMNFGYWGIPLRPSTTYTGRLFAKGNSSFTVTLESTFGEKQYATFTQPLTNSWQEYKFTLVTPADVKVTDEARLRVSFAQPGDYLLSRVTLFPPTYKNRPEGLRSDLMTLLHEMRPKFLRFPGGNYLEGNRFAERFDWKRTIGPTKERPGHQSPWGYWSTDGMGLLEFMEWIEDLGGEPLLAVFAGYTLNGDHVEGEALQPFIQDALDEIEYVIGGPETRWGAQRVKDGHPEPFPLHYVEIGNEDFFDGSGSYTQRFSQMYDAIKARYPQLQIISTVDMGYFKNHTEYGENTKVDVIDEHYYRNAGEMYRRAAQYDTYDRQGPKIFCGEWATREGSPTTNMNAALGDAAWMAGMERNSDIVVASCYAPLFVNVNKGAIQWQSDLIGYDVINSYGSPSYYAQAMFGQYLGDRIVPVTVEGMPNFTLSEKEGGGTVPEIYYTATKDSKTGRLYLKLVNAVGKAQTVELSLEGANKGKRKGEKVELKSAQPEDTNSIDNPKKIVPQKSVVKIGDKSKVVLAPYSVTVLAF